MAEPSVPDAAEALAELEDYVRNSAEKRAYGKTRAQQALAALSSLQAERDEAVHAARQRAKHIETIYENLAAAERETEKLRRELASQAWLAEKWFRRAETMRRRVVAHHNVASSVTSRDTVMGDVCPVCAAVTDKGDET